MDQKTAPIQNAQDKTQVYFIDGCKVTVRYGSSHNPSAVKTIKETLLTNGLPKKS